MVLLLLNHVVLRALWKVDIYLISTLVNKSLYYYISISSNEERWLLMLVLLFLDCCTVKCHIIA